MRSRSPLRPFASDTSLYERHADAAQERARPQAPALNADYYVTPKKLYPYDLKTAREQLKQQPVWVKVGYAVLCFPYDRVRKHADFASGSCKLLPLEKLDIQDVITDLSPDAPGAKQVMAVFERDGKSYAFSVGAFLDGELKFYGNDMLFIQDPHELYKHWSSDIWEAIDRHEVKAGMSELQASFAIGLGIPQTAG